MLLYPSASTGQAPDRITNEPGEAFSYTPETMVLALLLHIDQLTLEIRRAAGEPPR
jgi:hypothetical protein